MMLRLRIEIAGTAGPLGRVTWTLGVLGADVAQIFVVERNGGRARRGWLGLRHREDGPSFHRSELGRLRYMLDVLACLPGAVGDPATIR